MSGFSWALEIFPIRREKFIQNFPILNVGEWFRKESYLSVIHINSDSFILCLATPVKIYPRAFLLFFSRETREGWPLLTVETEVNRDSKCTNEKGLSLVGSLCLSCRIQDIFSSVLAGSVVLSCRYMRFFFSLGQVQNIFFLTVNFFNSVLGRLSLCMCLWFIPKQMPEFFPSASSINSTSALIVLPQHLKIWLFSCRESSNINW